MNSEAIINQIYCDPHQNHRIPHPETGTIYTLLTKEQLVDLAHKITAKLIHLGIQQVIVSESGAVLFAKICARLAQKNKLDISWYSVKIPRTIQENFQQTFKTYRSLSLDELGLLKEPKGFSYEQDADDVIIPEGYFDSQNKSLSDILAMIQVKADTECSELTNHSGLTAILKKPFIFFDEYIDSGKTLFQTIQFFKLFQNDLDFKILSYLIKLPDTALDKRFIQSLYTLNDAEQAYTTGLYPFENRIDYLGYFYRFTSKQFSKVTIKGLAALSGSYDYGHELKELVNQLNSLNLLEEIKKYIPIPEVSSFVTQEHFIQYCFYTLEKLYQGQEIMEFLYQLFDMNGPMWSPLPDSYHLSYLDAFEQHSPIIDELCSSQAVATLYKKIRIPLVQSVAQLCETRRLNMEKNYES